MYAKIMVPLDGSVLAESALAHLETVVKGSDNPEVVVVQAVEPISIPYGLEIAHFATLEQVEQYQTHQKESAEKYLNGIIERLKVMGIRARPEIVTGRASEALVEFAVKNNFDLVIIASHGRSGKSNRAWGSVADHLLRSLSLHVLIARSPECGPKA